MQAHRRQYGTFPNNLSDFANELMLAARAEHSTIDGGEPFRDEITPMFMSFTFSPNGTGSAFATLGDSNAATTIDATQPTLLCTAGTNVARISKLAWDAEAKISTPYIPKDTTRILYVDDATVAIPGALWGEWRVIGGKILGPDQSEQTR